LHVKHVKIVLDKTPGEVTDDHKWMEGVAVLAPEATEK